MSWTISDISDLSGKVAVVTGANGGLGFESAKALAGAGAHVVMAARNQDKSHAAHSQILEAHPEASLEEIELDLGSLDSVRAASEAISRSHTTIDILMNNAGLMALPERRTADGFEMQLGVNHLGHWVFTSRLLNPLLTADAARVVTVTSTARLFGRSVDPDNPNLDGRYDPWRAYNQSKLANYYFAMGLQREFDQRGLRAMSLVAHPGLSNTNLQSHSVDQGAGGSMGRFFLGLVQNIGMSPDRGALPQLRAATDHEVEGGQIYAPRYVNAGTPVRRPVLRRLGLSDAIDSLWETSERLTGETLDFDTTHGNA